MTLCECGCGGEAKPGNRYINGHNKKGEIPHNKGKHLTKEEKQAIDKKREINKLVKKGIIKLPFCKCGCGGRVSKLGNEYIVGHQSTGKTFSEIHKKHLSESFRGKVISEESKLKAGISLCKFYQTERGIEVRKQKSENMQGEKNIAKKSEVREKISKALTGDNNPSKRPEEREKKRQLIVKNLKNGVYDRKPTSPEFKYQQISENNNLSFRYTGDGQFWIGNKKKQVNPDFIECNGRKIAVEILGDYWHSALLNKHVKDDDLKKREKHYRRYKWKVIYIWESDIMRPEGEEFVLSLLRKEGVI